MKYNPLTRSKHTYTSYDVWELERYLADPFYSLRRYYIDHFFLKETNSLPTGSYVLDIGGHKTHKRGQFIIENYDFSIIYLNLTTEKRPDIQADAAYVPLASDSFTVVICAEVLEHVIDPSAVLREAYRLLQPEGILLASVPFLFRIHGDPYDFGRYTDHYLQIILEQTGFKKIEIRRQGLFFSVIADFFKQYAVDARWHKQRSRLPFVRLIYWLQRWALYCEHQHKFQKHEFFNSFTTGFSIKAYK